MELSLYSVYDKKAQSYGNPFTAVNDQVAERMFQQLSSDPQSTVAAHPTDFELYKIAVFNTETGHLTSEKPEWITAPTPGEVHGNTNEGPASETSKLQLQGS